MKYHGGLAGILLGCAGAAFAGDGVLTFPGPSTPKTTPEPPTLPQPNPTPQVPQTPGPTTAPPQRTGGMNHLFVCQSADQSRITLRTDTAGKLHLNDPNSGESATGTYTYDGTQISLSVPALQFSETTNRIEATKGLLLAFETSAVYCWLLGHEMGEAVEGYVKCPSIGYVQGIGWQENAFQFFQDHSVKWRRWDEYTAIVDTVYSESFGTYLIEGKNVSMAFGGREKERFLSGVIRPDGSLSINELEPEKGPCAAQ